MVPPYAVLTPPTAMTAKLRWLHHVPGHSIKAFGRYLEWQVIAQPGINSNAVMIIFHKTLSEGKITSLHGRHGTGNQSMKSYTGGLYWLINLETYS